MASDGARADGSGQVLQVVVMGVSGTGKSTVGAALAEQLGWPFLEGDDLHPRGNVAKMRAGEPLDDDDREPWLESIRCRVAERAAAGAGTVVACSALRRAYRDLLRDGVEGLFFVHLHASHDVLEARMARRVGHYMPVGLLWPQLDTMEPLGRDEDSVVLDVSGAADEVVAAATEAVLARLRR